MASNDWKKKNYNPSVKVSEKTINELRANKSFEGNVAKFKSGATAEQREAMNRFYGKSRVDSALGKSVSSVNKTYSASPGASYKGTASNNYKAPKGQQPVTKPSTVSKVANSGAGSFVKNELLGVDDFSSARKKIKSGDFGGAARSLGVGAFELGTTAAAVVGSAFTGGATAGALVAAKTAQVAGRQVGKAVVKTAVKEAGKHAAQGGAKTVASKAALGAGRAVNTVLSGSVKNAPKTAVKALKGAKKGAGAARSGLGAARVEAKMGKKFVAAQKTAARANAKATGATLQAKEASTAYRSLRASGAGKPVKGLNKAYDARQTAVTSARATRTTAVSANKRVTALSAERAKKLAAAKKYRQRVRNVAYITAGIKTYEKNK